MRQNNDFFGDKKYVFVLTFSGVFLATFLLLYFAGLVPSELSSGGNNVLDNLKLQTIESVSKPAPVDQVPTKIIGEKPIHITVPNVDIDINVEGPKTTDVAVLNEYLTRGAVHYPGSADLGAGNVFIFGHSSNWAVVHNKAYKALNGIDKLVKGDLIYVDSDSHRFVYEVLNVRRASADEAFVDLSSTKNMLTLSTCDVFGEKQNRFVAEAVFSKKIPL